jgi:hypothetical protein
MKTEKKQKSFWAKSQFIALGIIVSFVAVLIIDLIASKQGLAVASEYNLWDLAKRNYSYNDEVYAFSLILIICYFACLLPPLLAIISFIKKNNFGFTISFIFLAAYQIAFGAFRVIYKVLSSSTLILCVVNLLILLIGFGFFAWRKALLKKNAALAEPSSTAESNKPVSTKTKGLVICTLIIGIISTLLSFLMFIIPIYTDISGNVILFNVLISSENYETQDIVYFIICFVMLLGSLLYFTGSISSFFSNKNSFVSKIQTLIAFDLISAIAFFLMGFLTSFYVSKNGSTTSTISYIPLIAQAVCFLIFSIFKGLYDVRSGNVEVTKEKKSLKVEPLIFAIVFTVITFASLLLNIIKVTVVYGGTTINVSLTGIKLLQDYQTLGSGYQVLAFYLVVMVLVSFVSLIWTLASYFTRYKNFSKVAKATVYANILFVFMLGISGLYFTIAQEINKDNLKTLLALYNVSYDVSYEYKIQTEAIYALIADVLILVLMLIRSALDKDEGLGKFKKEPALSNESNSNSGSASVGGGLPSSTNLPDFDPCPAFSEIDAKENDYKNDLAVRQKSLAQDISLNGLVNFVVDYAKDSRLHLSYTPQTIATFVSGLGACRLSILQGMSGTGKTSLPKIFAEAIYGNCELIEVESSWKDKNELLGYYNEFSNMYTPKKFTQALYKSALNKDIPTFIVLDEMNLSRIEYYFSDFLSLMENEEDKREIKLLNVELKKTKGGQESSYLALEEGHTLKVPTNVWFIGTANRDESTFVISDKVYDRAHTMNFDRRAPKVKDYSDPIPKKFYDYDSLHTLFATAKKQGTFDAEKSDLIKSTEELLSPYNISFGNRILNQIEDFVDIYTACFPDKDVEKEAVETILLSKVVAKLELKTIENKADLVQSFEKIGLHRCAEFISKLNED